VRYVTSTSTGLLLGLAIRMKVSFPALQRADTNDPYSETIEVFQSLKVALR